MQSYRVKIVASKFFPYMMQNRMNDVKLEEWEKKRGFIVERDDVAKEDAVRAEYVAYRNDKGYYIPAEHIQGALIMAGKMVKAKVGVSKKSMTDIVAAMFSVTAGDGGTEIQMTPQRYEIDKRSAVNQKVKARVIVIRPKFKDWSCEFTLNVDNDTITQETIKNILECAGRYIGIGSYRPTQKGPFGRFEVESFSSIY